MHVVAQSIDFEGIVGMGFPEMSSTGATPIYDNIMNQAKLKRNEFAFYVAKGSPVGFFSWLLLTELAALDMSTPLSL